MSKDNPSNNFSVSHGLWNPKNEFNNCIVVSFQETAKLNKVGYQEYLNSLMYLVLSLQNKRLDNTLTLWEQFPLTTLESN